MTLRLPRAVLATVGLGTIFATVGFGSAAYAVDPDTLVEAVTVDGIMTHLEAFQMIADENGGNRAVGTAGYEASGAYVEAVLAEAGYTTERQTFDVTTQEFNTYSLDVAAVAPLDIVGIPMSYTTGTGAGGVTADVVAPAEPLGCDAAAWDGVDATGKIALVSRGTCTFGAKSLAAKAAGATGAIIYNNTEGDLNGTLGTEQVPEFAPTAGVTLAEGNAILAALENGPVSAALVIDETTSTASTFNVITETPTGRDDNTVMLGAHLDGIPEGPGINDNGSGSAAILEVAVQLAEQGELNNQVRFAWWGAEEIGLLGSTHYVADLVANNPQELDEIATYLNFDMVGSPNYVIGVYDADESTYPAPVEVPEGSIATESVFTDYFDTIGQPWVDSEFSGRSDYQAFIAAGVPASGLFTGADDIKTAEEAALFGGVVGEQHDQNYHAVGDDIDNIDMTALDITSNAIAFATAALANDTSAVNGVLPPTVPVIPAPAVPGAVPGPPTLAATGGNVDAQLVPLASALFGAGLIGVTVAASRRKAAVAAQRD